MPDHGRFPSYTFSLLIAFVLCASCSVSGQSQAVRVTVSPLGDDRWSGRLADPNPSRTDGPVRTLERARDLLRSTKQSNRRFPPSGISVEIRSGVYQIHRSLILTDEDSGTEETPVVWRASPGESVILSGGKPLTEIGPVRDPAVRRRLSAEARERVLTADLRACGMTDFGSITPRGTPGMELFFRGERMTLARWPNRGWLRIAGVPQTGDTLFHPGLDREKRFDGIPAGRHYGRITYDGNRPATWSQENQIYLHGYWTFDWSDAYQRVATIDTVHREITLAAPHHGYGYTRNQRYYFLNILEELDAPGEWYLDREQGRLYFWPPGPIDSGSVVVSQLSEPMFILDQTRFVRIEGLSLKNSRGTAIVINGGTGNQVAGGTFSNLGNDAVLVNGGTNNGVLSCNMFDLALGAVRLSGGDRARLTPAGNFASNNHIHHYGQWVRTGQYALIADGVGHRIDHNLIHDAPFEAIYVRGNDHLLEYNEIHHVTQETGDAGAIHTGRNWTWRGNVIRYNFFHDLQGPGLHGVMAVYLDDWASGFAVYGNIFVRAGRATLIGGGRNNTVENNIYIECAPSVHVDARGLGWAGYYFDGTRRELFEQMEEVRYDRPPYSIRYPTLLTMYDGETAVPKGNVIRRNISAGGRWMDVYDYSAFDLSVVTIKDNFVADPILLRRRKDGEKGWDPYYIDIDMKEGYVALRNEESARVLPFAGNTITRADPGFVDASHGDFRLTPDASAGAIGFSPIPFEKIGLQKDVYRHSPP